MENDEIILFGILRFTYKYATDLFVIYSERMCLRYFNAGRHAHGDADGTISSLRFLAYKPELGKFSLLSVFVTSVLRDCGYSRSDETTPVHGYYGCSNFRATRILIFRI